jgi:glycosyltransferase
MTPKSDVKVSVVTVTWNCAETVEECLGSVSQQTWQNREHVVIDGASNDGTVKLLEGRRSQLAVLVSERDKGIYDALNKGIALSSGDVVGFLHADDLYAHSGVLADVAQAFSDPAVSAVYGDLQYVKQQDPSQVVRRWKSSTYSTRQLARGWMPPHPTLYVRREWYQRIGGFDSRYRIAADYFSILQLFSQPDFKAVYLPQVMVKMRLGGASNRSIKNMVRKSREDYDALRRSGFNPIGGVAALIAKNLSKIPQFL